MTTPAQPTATQSRTVMFTVVMLIAVATMFIIIVVISSGEPTNGPVNDPKSDTYVAEVTALLANADATRGVELVTKKYECGACHIQGAGKTAPDFVGLSERAATEHPPLTAAAYLYESIMFPTAHMVAGFANSMPPNYNTRLSKEELGDIIAYLLTQ